LIHRCRRFGVLCHLDLPIGTVPSTRHLYNSTVDPAARCSVRPTLQSLPVLLATVPYNIGTEQCLFPLGRSTDTPTPFRGSFRLTLYDAHRFTIGRSSGRLTRTSGSHDRGPVNPSPSQTLVIVRTLSNEVIALPVRLHFGCSETANCGMQTAQQVTTVTKNSVDTTREVTPRTCMCNVHVR
jgi:hypothetical protein